MFLTAVTAAPLVKYAVASPAATKSPMETSNAPRTPAALRASTLLLMVSVISVT
ncbi:hypothetical protein D3C71_1840830 [compost metagenome]